MSLPKSCEPFVCDIPSRSPSRQDEFAADILRGADEIALYFYGERELRRKIYHLVATSRLPIFKLGSMICARRSVLKRWIEEQEQRHSGARTKEDA